MLHLAHGMGGWCHLFVVRRTLPNATAEHGVLIGAAEKLLRPSAHVPSDLDYFAAADLVVMWWHLLAT